MNEDVFIRTIKLPSTVKGVTLPNPDGTFDIYVNSDLTIEQRALVVAHEIAHIQNDDFYRYDPVPVVEEQAG